MFTRRALFLAGGQAALVSALVGRMYYLQVVESDRYVTLAEDNRINLRLLAPLRGRLLDSNGMELAGNRTNYRVVLIAEQARDVAGVLDRLAQVVDLSAADRQRILREVGRRRSFVPVTVRENLDWETVTRIEVNAPDLPGVQIEAGQSRHYPLGPVFAHALGYVGAVSEAELTGDPLLELPGFRVGKSGIERQYDGDLRGSGGTSQVEVNAVGRVIRELERDEGVAGENIALTLDSELQSFAMRRLSENVSGGAVVADVNTGGILALASWPSFDPNLFVSGIDVATWRTLSTDTLGPLTNKAISGAYAPGSTFKMIVALAALDAGVISPDTSFYCNGKLPLGDKTFFCWKRHGHGTVNLSKSLSESCDVYYYEVARKVGIDRIVAMARRLGLGNRLGIDLPGEQPGLIPSKSWKLANLGEAWQLGETLISGIGQGFITATPLQLAMMTAAIANGGRIVRPTLRRGLADSAPTEAIGLDPRHLALVQEGMYAVSNTPRGTAYGSRISEPAMTMAGKTGTSQVRRISRAERDTRVLTNDELEWRQRDHALFVGYAPAQAPRYAVSVVVEHGGSGSATAAPIARDLLRMAMTREAVAEAVPDSGTGRQAG